MALRGSVAVIAPDCAHPAAESRIPLSRGGQQGKDELHASARLAVEAGILLLQRLTQNRLHTLRLTAGAGKAELRHGRKLAGICLPEELEQILQFFLRHLIALLLRQLQHTGRMSTGPQTGFTLAGPVGQASVLALAVKELGNNLLHGILHFLRAGSGHERAERRQVVIQQPGDERRGALLGAAVGIGQQEIRNPGQVQKRIGRDLQLHPAAGGRYNIRPHENRKGLCRIPR